MRCVVTIPGLRVTTPGNTRRHWAAERKDAAAQRAAGKLAVLSLGRDALDVLRAAPKIRVRFVRVGGRKMDPTNLVSAFKHCQDGMADAIGIDDGSDRYAWEWPAQEPGAGYAVRIELETLEGE